MAKRGSLALIWRWLGAIKLWHVVLASVVIRVVAAFALGNTVEELPGIFDQISYHTLATRVLDGYGFSFGEAWWPLTKAGAPTAHWSFLYTLYLVLVYQLFGITPLVARVIQAIVVGVAMPWFTYRLSSRVFGSRVGMIAAVWTSFYGYFIYYAAALITESFFLAAVLWSFDAAVRIGQNVEKPKVRDALELGIAFGISILLRQLFLLVIPFILLWILWARIFRSPSKQTFFSVVRLGVIVGAILVLLITPITLYNYQRFDRFVLLNTNSGFVFFWGNHPVYGTDFVPILTADMGTYQSLIPEEVRHLDEAALDSELLGRGLQFIVDDPVRYIALSISRIPEYFNFWPSAYSSLPSNLTRVVSFGLALPFMLVGLFQWAKKLSFSEYKAILAQPATLIVIFMGVYSGIHILTWTLIRYRLPVDALALAFAAYGLHSLWKLFANRERPSVHSQAA